MAEAPIITAEKGQAPSAPIPGVRQAAVAKAAGFGLGRAGAREAAQDRREAREGQRMRNTPRKERVLVPGHRGRIAPHVEVSTGAVRSGEKAV